MLRVVVRTDDCGMAANVGGNVHTEIHTFDIEAPCLEVFLRQYTDKAREAERQRVAFEAATARGDKDAWKHRPSPLYWHRHVVGVEVLEGK